MTPAAVGRHFFFAVPSVKRCDGACVVGAVHRFINSVRWLIDCGAARLCLKKRETGLVSDPLPPTAAGGRSHHGGNAWIS